MSRKILLILSLLFAITVTAVYADEISDYLLPHDYINYVETTEKVDNNITIIYMYNKDNHNLILKTFVRHIEFDEGCIEALTRDKIHTFCIERGYYHFKNFSNSMIQYHNDNIVFTRFIYLYK